MLSQPIPARPDQLDADGHWLAGLTDGEGCFSLHVRQRKTGPSYIRIDFGFKIAMRLDDLHTLLEARRILGVKGCVYSSSARRGPNGKPLAAIAVSRKSDIATVIQFFRAYPLRSKKRRDFEIWAAAFERFTGAIETTPLQAVSLGKEIHRSRTGVRRPVVGTPRRRFRTVPSELLDELSEAADALRTMRIYRA